VARELIAAGARRAVERAAAGELRALELQTPVEVGIDFRHAGQADFAAVIPGFERAGDRGVRYRAADGIDAYRAFVAAVRIADIADE
jgi:D-amino peptidase